jgi:hypothetical protein
VAGEQKARRRMTGERKKKRRVVHGEGEAVARRVEVSVAIVAVGERAHPRFIVHARAGVENFQRRLARAENISFPAPV